MAASVLAPPRCSHPYIAEWGAEQSTLREDERIRAGDSSAHVCGDHAAAPQIAPGMRGEERGGGGRGEGGGGGEGAGSVDALHASQCPHNELAAVIVRACVREGRHRWERTKEEGGSGEGRRGRRRGKGGQRLRLVAEDLGVGLAHLIPLRLEGVGHCEETQHRRRQSVSTQRV